MKKLFLFLLVAAAGLVVMKSPLVRAEDDSAMDFEAMMQEDMPEMGDMPEDFDEEEFQKLMAELGDMDSEGMEMPEAGADEAGEEEVDHKKW